MPEEIQRNIQVVDAPDLDSFDLSKINNSLAIAYDKLQRIANNDISMVLHFKEYNTAGRREKFSIHLRLAFPGNNVVASAVSWKAPDAVQQALRILERETVELIKRKEEKGRRP
jgi:hypothetical protein